jgi:hypothetical protein
MQSGVESGHAVMHQATPREEREAWSEPEVGVGTVPGDPTKIKVVMSPVARNRWARRDGKHLEGPHRPVSANWRVTETARESRRWEGRGGRVLRDQPEARASALPDPQ